MIEDITEDGDWHGKGSVRYIIRNLASDKRERDNCMIVAKLLF